MRIRATPRQFLEKIWYSPLTKVLVIIAIFGSLALFSQSSVFSVKVLNCKTQYGPCTDNENTILKDFEGQNLITFNSKEIINRFSGDYMNRKVNVQKVFPNTLVVRLEKRKAQLALATKSRTDFFLIDRDGVVVEYAKSSNLPLLLVGEFEGIAVGAPLNSELQSGAKVLYAAFRSLGIKEGIATNGEITTSTIDGIEVVFPLDRDPSVLTGALQLILRRSKIDGRLPKVIDLRYSKPVLRY